MYLLPVIARMEPGWAIGLGVACLIGAPLLLYAWYRAMFRKRLMEDVPTSKVKGVAMGLTELKGRAECDRPLTSYLAGCECGWFSYSIEEHYRRTKTDSEGKTTTTSGWETVDSGGRMTPFHLADDTGRIRIKPRHAEIDGHRVFNETVYRSDALYYSKGPSSGIYGSTGKRRFVEHAIRPGDELYVMGSAELRQDIPEPQIAYDRDGEMFMISVRSEEQIVSSQGWGGLAAIVFGGLFVLAGPLLLVGHRVDSFGDALAMQKLWCVAAVLLFAACAAGAYAMLLFNGLVGVMTRMEKAWTLIDIQLQRRHDLIPQLVECAKSLAKHEKELQVALASLRNNPQRGRGRPGGANVAANAEVANQQTEALSQIVAVVERYPTLKSNEAFLKLQYELADTEDRIALARGFYNESVTAYNSRIMTFPDVVFANVFSYKPGQLYEIRDFERRPVVIDWSSRAKDDDDDGDGAEAPKQAAPKKRRRRKPRPKA